MSRLILEEVTIKNFKSLKDVTLQVHDINIILGKNGAGKSNILQFFKFTKNIFNFNEYPYRPLISWWTYKDLVYLGNEHLNIEAKFVFRLNNIKLVYKYVFGFNNGIYQIHMEEFEIGDTMKIVRNELAVSQYLSDSLYSKYLPLLQEDLQRKPDLFSWHQQNATKCSKFVIKKELNTVTSQSPSTILLSPLSRTSVTTHIPSIPYFVYYNIENNCEVCPVFLPQRLVESLSIDNQEFNFISMHGIQILIFGFLANISFLRHPSFDKIKVPTLIAGEKRINEDGSNLNSILLQYFEQHQGKLPSNIAFVLKHMFNNASIRFKRTEDGRSYFTLLQGEYEFNPPGISDGFYKIILLLIALQSNSNLILIDELENSLYYEAIKFLLAEFRQSGKQFIITSHSTVTIDMCSLNELMLISNDTFLTKISQLTESEVTNLKQYLTKEGLAYSDAWLAGVLNKLEEII